MMQRERGFGWDAEPEPAVMAEPPVLPHVPACSTWARPDQVVLEISVGDRMLLPLLGHAGRQIETYLTFTHLIGPIAVIREWRSVLENSMRQHIVLRVKTSNGSWTEYFNVICAEMGSTVEAGDLGLIDSIGVAVYRRGSG